MRQFNYVFITLLICICLSGCKTKLSLKEEVVALKEEWGFKFPLPSENDSINLLSLQMEKAYFTLERDKMDSLARKILEIDSTFYMAISFQAFKKWPFDLEKLKKAKQYSLKDTTVHRLIFDGDYSYWIKHDSITARKIYTEVYNRYPNSKIAAWLAAMACMWANDYKMAISYLKRSLEIEPKFYYAYLDMGDAYLKSKQYNKALENFNILLKHYPAKFGIHRYIGNTYLGLNDSIKANNHFHIADSMRKAMKK